MAEAVLVYIFKISRSRCYRWTCKGLFSWKKQMMATVMVTVTVMATPSATMMPQVLWHGKRVANYRQVSDLGPASDAVDICCHSITRESAYRTCILQGMYKRPTLYSQGALLRHNGSLENVGFVQACARVQGSGVHNLNNGLQWRIKWKRQWNINGNWDYC